MAVIYVILGIVGWVAVAIAIPIYVWVGSRRTPTAVRSDSSGADGADHPTAQRSA